MPNDYNNDEAKALAEQARQFDEARRQTANAPSIDKALAGIDWSTALPPGVDPKAYVEAMVAKGENAFISDSQPAPATPRPRTLNITSYGFTRAPADAKPGDVVEIDFGGGRLVTVEVEQAVRQGFIKRDRDGGYRPIGADEIEAEKVESQRRLQDEEQQSKADLEQQRLTGDAPDAQLQHAINVVNSRVPPAATQALTEDYILNGGVSVENLEKVAAHVGLSFEQAQQLAMSVHEGVYRQASLALTTSGIPAEEVEAVFAYAREHHTLDIKGAVRELAFHSNASVFRHLAGKYKAWKHIRTQR